MKNDPKPKISVNLSRLSGITGYTVSHLSRVFNKKCGYSVKCLFLLSGQLCISAEELSEAILEGRIHVSETR